MLLSKALEGYWLDKRLELSKSTNQYTLKVFKEFVNDCEVDQITVSKLKQYLIYLTEQRNLSKRSIGSNYIVLSSFFTWYSTEFNVENPMRKVSKLNNRYNHLLNWRFKSY